MGYLLSRFLGAKYGGDGALARELCVVLGALSASRGLGDVGLAGRKVSTELA